MRSSAVQKKTDASHTQELSVLRARKSPLSKGDNVLDARIKPELRRPPVLFGCIAPLRELYPLRHHQADFDQLQANGVLEHPMTLNSLSEGEVAEHPPPHSIKTLIKCAILGSPRQRLTLKELRIALRRRFHYYANTDSRRWCNTLRYYLSTDEDFVRVPRQPIDGDKGAWWTVRDVANPPNLIPSNRSSKKLALFSSFKLQNRGKNKEAQKGRRPTHSPCDSSSVTGDTEALGTNSGHGHSISNVHTNSPTSHCHLPHPPLHPPRLPQLSLLPPLQQPPLEAYMPRAHRMTGSSTASMHSYHVFSIQSVPSSERSHNSLPGIRDLGLLDFGRGSIRSAPSH